jgi:hypothetical protein
VFWQFYNQGGVTCANLPPATATTQQLYDFFNTVEGWTATTDQESAAFLQYDYQAGTQLGYPVEPQRYLLPYLKYPDGETARAYVPRSIPMRFDPSVMRDIDH